MKIKYLSETASTGRRENLRERFEWLEEILYIMWEITPIGQDWRYQLAKGQTIKVNCGGKAKQLIYNKQSDIFTIID